MVCVLVAPSGVLTARRWLTGYTFHVMPQQEDKPTHQTQPQQQYAHQSLAGTLKRLMHLDYSLTLNDRPCERNAQRLRLSSFCLADALPVVRDIRRVGAPYHLVYAYSSLVSTDFFDCPNDTSGSETNN